VKPLFFRRRSHKLEYYQMVDDIRTNKNGVEQSIWLNQLQHHKNERIGINGQSEGYYFVIRGVVICDCTPYNLMLKITKSYDMYFYPFLEVKLVAD
jgi:hypothetical protein